MSVMWCPLYVVCCSVCFVCCVFDSVCELLGETIRNVFGCSCYFVVECYGCRKLSPHLGSLRAGSQVFALLNVISLCDFAYYVYRARACSCYASCPFGMLCLSAISMMFVKIMLAVGMVV